jgi:hypothetical protein
MVVQLQPVLIAARPLQALEGMAVQLQPAAVEEMARPTPAAVEMTAPLLPAAVEEMAHLRLRPVHHPALRVHIRAGLAQGRPTRPVTAPLRIPPAQELAPLHIPQAAGPAALTHLVREPRWRSGIPT